MIRKVNDVLPGVRRPFRMEDIEFLWEGLSNVLASGVTTTPVILSGFNINSDNTISAGVLAFNGQLFMHPDETGYKIPLGSNVYWESVPSENDKRNFEDGTVQPMYYYQVLTTNASGGNLVGQFTEDNIAAWRYAGTSLDIDFIDVPGISKIVDITQTVATIPFPTASAEALIKAIQKKRQTYFVDTETGDAVLPFPIPAQCYADFSASPVTEIMGSAVYSNPIIALPALTAFNLSLTSGAWTLALSMRNFLIGGNFVQSDGSVEVSQVADFKNGIKSRGNEVLTGIPDNSVTTSKLANGAVTTDKIANEAVTTDKIANEAVTSSKMAKNSVGDYALQTGSITNEKISDRTISGIKLVAKTVDTLEIADNAITSAKIANDSISTEKIVDNSITRLKMADNSVGTDTLQDSTVTFPKLYGAVTNEIRNMILQFTLNIQTNNTTVAEILYNPLGIKISPWSYSTAGLGGFELQGLGSFLPQRCFLTSNPVSATSEIRNTLIYTSGSPTVARYDAINYVTSMAGASTYANGKILVSVYYNY